MAEETKNQISELVAPPDTPTPAEKTPSSFGAVGLFVYDFLKVFVVAVAIIIPVRWFLFQPFVVTGDSMKPNFENGNYLIIDELSYRLHEPGRGDVVVLRYPNDPSQFFIKRIVGLPGERIKISNDQVTIYNSANPQGLALRESYIPPATLTQGDIDRTLGSDEYFVLGDNRMASSDSRIWGMLKRKLIVGRVYVRILPMQEFGLFHRPSFGPVTP